MNAGDSMELRHAATDVGGARKACHDVANVGHQTAHTNLILILLKLQMLCISQDPNHVNEDCGGFKVGAVHSGMNSSCLH